MNTRRAAWFAIGVVIMALVMTAAITVVKTTQTVDLIRSEQKANVERSKDTNANTETIKRLAEAIDSCTNPKGECAKRNAKATGQAVASISEAVIAAVTCAKRPEVVTTAQTRACVKHELGGG